MEWLNDKLHELDDFRQAFPSVFWSGYFLILLVAASMMLYFPVLSKIANLEILSVKPWYSMVMDNMDTLKWGFFVVPVVVGLIGWGLIDDLYQRKLKRYYRY